MTSFSSLRQANIARHKEWTSMGYGNVSLSYRGNELAGETGEACNVIKKLDRARMGRAGSRATIPQLIEELADIYICLDLIQMDLGITPEEMEQKICEKFNKTSLANGHETRLVFS